MKMKMKVDGDNFPGIGTAKIDIEIEMTPQEMAIYVKELPKLMKQMRKANTINVGNPFSDNEPMDNSRGYERAAHLDDEEEGV